MEEERPRRARGTAQILRCYPVPIHFQNATLLNSQYYFTAQFPAAGMLSPQPFTVGDNKTYNGYWNVPLLPQKSYSVYFQAVSTANGVGGRPVGFDFAFKVTSSWLPTLLVYCDNQLLSTLKNDYTKKKKNCCRCVHLK